MVWILSRQINIEEQSVCIEGIETTKDNLRYFPTINAPATEMATAAEILKNTRKIMKQLHLKEIVVVFDQALYANVAEVLWKNKQLNKGVIIRLGTFHTICKFLSILGKRFQDAGLRDLCIEAGIIAEGSVAAVMEGRHYNSTQVCL